MKSQEYLRKLTKPISNAELRNEIMKEYQDHIEDCKAALIESGMDENTAEEEAVLQMGDPTKTGLMLRKVHNQRFDKEMLLWMIFLALISLLLQPLWKVAIMNSQYAGLSHTTALWIGGFLLIYGYLLSVNETYRCKPLFYSYPRGILINSGTILILGASFLFRSYQKGLITLAVVTILQSLLRMATSNLRSRKEAHVLWTVGITDTDVLTYKGYCILNGKRQKAVTRDSMVPKGTPVIVTAYEDAKVVIESLT